MWAITKTWGLRALAWCAILALSHQVDQARRSAAGQAARPGRICCRGVARRALSMLFVLAGQEVPIRRPLR